MKYILILILSIFSFNAYSGWFDGKSILYECSSETDAYSCSAECVKTNREVSFQINVDANKVMRENYEDGKMTGTFLLDNCSVFDKKNFKCGRGLKSIDEIGLISKIEFNMKNGRFVTIISTFNVINNRSFVSAYCTK
jgi:hypothetical protein